MGITPTDYRIQTTTCKKFLKGIVSNSLNCNIGVYIYHTPGISTNWVVVLKILRRLGEKYQRVFAGFSAASSSAPDSLTRCKLRDAIAKIQTVVNSAIIVFATSLLDTLLPYNANQIVAGSSTMEVEQIAELSDLINFGDCIYVNEEVLLCIDLRIVNN